MRLRAAAIVPVFDEREAIETTLREIDPGLCPQVVVVDGGSVDGTPDAATALGATVVVEPTRGYGLAVRRGVEAAEAIGAEAFLIVDGNGVFGAADMAAVLRPVVDDEADLVIGVRPPETQRAMQRLGNRLATAVVAASHGVRYRDVGAPRAVTRAAYRALAITEDAYGWPLQVQVRACANGLRIEQVDVSPRPRIGHSLVSGTVRGRAGAARDFLRVLARECAPRIAGRAMRGAGRAGR